uniref:DNA-directed DNA polymerase n=1 Tax=Ditylenchus dipsaci TaxID=166011 RepID=A0A915DL16_9BILA
MTGCKIFEATARNGQGYSRVKFRDSFLLMNVKLDSLKSTFGLSTESKGIFPHYYNTPENYNVHLDHLPEKHYYGYDTMTNDPFYLPDDLKSYCANDTAILQEAFLKMREIFLNITDGYDVLQDACTIAGVCMKLYKESSLEKDHLYIVPEKGYERNDRQSAIAIKWMEWVSEQRGINIQHAGNGGEFKIKTTMGRCFKLDGYDLENLKAYEFNGCHYHGCPKCYKRGDKQQANFKSAEENLAITEKRLADLRTSIEYAEQLVVALFFSATITFILAFVGRIIQIQVGLFLSVRRFTEEINFVV